MPKQHRWAIKKKLEQTNLALDKAQNYLVEVGHEYQGVHDDYYHHFVGLVTSIELVKSGIDSINKEI